MSYTSFAVYMQRRPFVAPPGGDCAPYTMPSPLAVETNLDTIPPIQTVTAVETILCAEVS